MKRRGRRGDDAQAVLETALILPILLFLVCNFIGVMVQVTVQEQLNSATALAAQSRFQAPNNAVDPAGTRCCGAHESQLTTAGLPTGCRYAAETFYGTMTTYTGMLVWQTAPLCTSGGDSGDATHARWRRTRIPARLQTRTSPAHRLDRSGGVIVPGYLDRTLQPPNGLTVVTCSATTRLDFSKTPLAWGVFWSPPCTRSQKRCRHRFASERGRHSRTPASAAWPTLIVFALGFSLFLFGLTCLVADSAYLYVWSGRVKAAAQLGAQSGADAVDPRFLYAQSVQVVDINPDDMQGALYTFQRACIQAGDQSARVPRDSAALSLLETSGRCAGAGRHRVRERWLPGLRDRVPRGASAHSAAGIP